MIYTVDIESSKPKPIITARGEVKGVWAEDYVEEPTHRIDGILRMAQRLDVLEETLSATTWEQLNLLNILADVGNKETARILALCMPQLRARPEIKELLEKTAAMRAYISPLGYQKEWLTVSEEALQREGKEIVQDWKGWLMNYITSLQMLTIDPACEQ